MSEQIGALRKKLLAEIDVMSKSMQDKRKLLDLLVTQCDHVYEDADDLYNYHNRISYVRCKHCGDVG
jgi:hypothetical protein